MNFVARLSLCPRRGSVCACRFTCAASSRASHSPEGDYVERDIDLNEWLIGNKLATYIVRVKGNSMAGEIHSGDWLIVDRSLEPRHRSVVIACVDGEMTVKRLLVEGGRCFLAADNPEYPRLEIEGDREMVIWGVVTNAVRRL